MRTSLTPVDIANEIRMTRTLYDGAFLIVEGDTDARFYKRIVDSGKCRITIAQNRENAARIVTILQGDNFAGFLAIVDADFDALEGKVFVSSNIFLTDTHDLETMILKSPALEKLLLEMESETKLDEFVKGLGKELREALLEEGLHLGYLRWVSLRHGHALKFEGLKYRAFTDLTTLTINQSKLIKTVKNHSQKLHPSDQDFMLPSGRGKRSMARSGLFRLYLKMPNTEFAHCLMECDREKGKSEVISGKRKPSKTQIKKLAEFFGVTPAVFISLD